MSAPAKDAVGRTVNVILDNSEKLTEALEQLAHAFAKATPHGWSHLVDYQRALAAGELLVGVAQMLTVSAVCWFCVKMYKKHGAEFSAASEDRKAALKLYQDTLDQERSDWSSNHSYSSFSPSKSETFKSRNDYLRTAQLPGGNLGAWWLAVALVALGANVFLAYSVPASLASLVAPQRAAAIDLIQAARVMK